MHSYTSEAAIAAKVLQNPCGQCISVLTDFLGKKRFALSLTPHSNTSGTQQSRIFGWMFILLIHCRVIQVKLSEGSQSRRYHGPNMATVSCSHGAFLPAALRAAIPWDLLHVTGPSQCPRVDEPHPASIACARPAVAGSARKGVAHVIRQVRNSSSVADRYHLGVGAFGYHGYIQISLYIFRYPCYA